MTKIQYIDDNTGSHQFVVLPIADDENLVNGGWEDIPYHADEHDDEKIPGEVVAIMVGQDVSLPAAWRIHCGLSQYDVAEKLGTTQSAVSQWESVDSKPQLKTRKKLALLYGCRPEQLIL